MRGDSITSVAAESGAVRSNVQLACELQLRELRLGLHFPLPIWTVKPSKGSQRWNINKEIKIQIKISLLCDGFEQSIDLCFLFKGLIYFILSISLYNKEKALLYIRIIWIWVYPLILIRYLEKQWSILRKFICGFMIVREWYLTNHQF